jgi:hypothetical protein
VSPRIIVPVLIEATTVESFVVWQRKTDECMFSTHVKAKDIERLFDCEPCSSSEG